MSFEDRQLVDTLQEVLELLGALSRLSVICHSRICGPCGMTFASCKRICHPWLSQTQTIMA